MTIALQRAFAEASKLPESEQELLASRLMSECAAEDAFDRAIAATGDKLGLLAMAALHEYRSGLTLPLDPERL